MQSDLQAHIAQLKQRGILAMEARHYADALDAFQAILVHHPDFADVRHYAGLCLVFLGRTEEALEQFNRALERNPRYVEAHVNRALLLQDLGRYEEARESFEQAGRYEQETEGRFPAAVAARLADTHAALADLYLDVQAFEEALAQYRSALGLGPSFHDIRNRYASALIAAGRPDDAAAELEQVLAQTPGFLAARLNLGLARFRQGRHDEAATAWEACAAAEPEHPQVRAYLALLQRRESERDG
ncbi:MAG TPA: tetratricopeptide repeat protein [Longimicrobiales bacterium]|nr:tetratricopeptide repeat protein [Longimicrobiales bacterium]